jgi:tripartite-type tricarboxylate transporter receptor subunit TctC
MKAIISTSDGAQLADVPAPQVKPNEILVRVEAVMQTTPACAGVPPAQPRRAFSPNQESSMRTTRRLACQAFAAALALGASCAALAQSGYPDKPVKVVVGFAPGGTNDILARLISQKLQERFKQPFVVDNRPGANSAIAAEYVAKAPPDGYTIFVASSGALTVNPALYPKLAYNPVKDYVPVALLGSFPLVVAVNVASPVKDLKGLIAAAKQPPHKSIDNAVSSSSFQLAAEILARDTGIKFNHIPYKGTGPAISALLGSEVQVTIVDIAPLIPQIKAGKLRALAVTTSRRSTMLPDVPTVAEAGVPGYEVPIWTGLVVPKGTPAEVTNPLKEALKEILAEKDVVMRMEALGMEPGNTDSAAFARQISGDLAKWTSIAKSTKFKAD